MDIFRAASYGNYQQVLDFLDAGGDPNITTPNLTGGARSLLSLAVNNVTDDVLLLLLEAGADPNLGDPSPLNMAARRGNSSKMRVLLDAGADPNDKNRWGLTPLHFAADSGRDDAIRLLLEAGADPTLTNLRGERPSQMSRNPKIKELLEEAEYAWNHPWTREEHRYYPEAQRLERVGALSVFRGQPGRELPPELREQVFRQLP